MSGDLLGLLVTTLFVIAVSAFCSLCEAVLYSLPAAHIAQLRERGDASAKRLEALRGRIDRPITAILTVNTIANTAGAAVAGALAANALGDGNVILFSAGLTVAILLFSEILPKTFGVVYTRALAPWLARPLVVMVVVLTPAIALIGYITRLIARDAAPDVSQEDLITMARLGSVSGVIDAGEAAVIENILSLPNTPVRTIMTPRPVVYALPTSARVADVLGDKRLMVHSRIPVYGTGVDDVVGMVFRRDVLSVEEPDEVEIGALVRPVEFVGEGEAVDRTLEILLAKKRHMLVVLGEFGEFSGVVTLEDVLEEILGEEIVDEFDQVADLRELAMTRKAATIERMKRK